MQEQEEINLATEEKGWLGKIKDSVYENWQTILVALIVLIVGISAYNYNSQTGANPSGTAVEEEADGEDQTDAAATDDDTAEQEAAAEAKDQEVAAEQDQATAAATNDDSAEDSAAETNTEDTETAVKNTNTVATEGESYKVTAVKGDGLTHLARKALNKYLEENSDDQLTAEHKVYIEDYLRKQVGSGQIEIGHEETFSKDLIKTAIASSKQLSQKSLDNLKKYTVAK